MDWVRSGSGASGAESQEPNVIVGVDWVTGILFGVTWIVVGAFFALLSTVRVRYTDRKDKLSRSHRAGGDTSKGVPTE